jgi:hypothetical protein
MKAKLIEFDGAFLVDLEPESKEDLALLVRLGLNGIKEPTDFWVNVHKDLTASASIRIMKRIRVESRVKA